MADDHPQEKDLTDGRVVLPVVFLPLHQFRLGENDHVFRQRRLQRLLHLGQVGSRIQLDDTERDLVEVRRAGGPVGKELLEVAVAHDHVAVRARNRFPGETSPPP